MPVVIPDEALREAGLNPHEALLVEFACRLFDAGKLTLPSAVRLAAMSRVAFEQELRSRRIPIYRPTLEDLNDDMEALKQLEI
jgi:predicted HTH domain antitoxin